MKLGDFALLIGLWYVVPVLLKPSLRRSAG